VLRALGELGEGTAGRAIESAHEILDHVLEAGERWAEGSPIEDDVTVVVIRVRRNTATSGSHAAID
jgi:serine phosphatase RsbU (regulator of sigma subunit)